MGFRPVLFRSIYIAVWLNPKFLSTILYTCGEFDETRAVDLVREFFQIGHHEAAIFKIDLVRRRVRPSLTRPASRIMVCSRRKQIGRASCRERVCPFG